MIDNQPIWLQVHSNLFDNKTYLFQVKNIIGISEQIKDGEKITYIMAVDGSRHWIRETADEIERSLRQVYRRERDES